MLYTYRHDVDSYALRKMLTNFSIMQCNVVLDLRGEVETVIGYFLFEDGPATQTEERQRG